MTSNKKEEIIEDKWLELIIDDLAGQTTSDDKAKLNDWMNSSSTHAAYYDELKEIWLTIEVVEESKQFDDRAAFKNFKERIKTPKRKSIPLSGFLKYTATVIVLLAIGAYFYFSNTPKSPTSSTDLFALNSITVPEGSTSKIEFNDGSKIWMNSGTEMNILKPKEGSERRIRLDGEAYLEVNHSDISLFTVETERADVKVYGTTFNVNAYSYNNELKVTLESGSVEVETELGEKVKITPSQQLIYNLVDETVTVKNVDVKKELAWRMNNLIFSGEPFNEIIEILENKFKVKIKVAKKELLNIRFTGDFVNGEDIEQIMKVMSANGRFKYNIKEKHIYIY